MENQKTIYQPPEVWVISVGTEATTLVLSGFTGFCSGLSYIEATGWLFRW